MLVQLHLCHDGCCFRLLDSRSGGRQFRIGQMDQIHKLNRISEVGHREPVIVDILGDGYR
jgi:hypothetical protein